MVLLMLNDIFKKDFERFFKFLCNIKIYKLKKKILLFKIINIGGLK